MNDNVIGLTAVNLDLDATDLRPLVDQARAGDLNAFGELCRAVEGRLVRQATLICQDPALAEDLAQETLFEGWKSLGRFNGQCQFFTWLCAILLNRSRNAARRKRPVPFSALSPGGAEERSLLQSVDPQDLPDQQAQRAERAALLRESVAKLPPKQREVIHLRFFVEDSIEGIAGALGCSVGTVKSRLFHALEKLRRMSEIATLP